MPEPSGKTDPGALIKQIRGYVQSGDMEIEVAMGLTLTAVADMLEGYQEFKGHTHPIAPEVVWVRRAVAVLGPIVVVGAITLLVGLLTHRMTLVFAVP